MKQAARAARATLISPITAAITTALCAGLLAACGGGGSSTSATTSTTGDVTLAGVVSTTSGVAASGRTVTAKCATGSGSVTTNADGTYRFTISAAALPCLLESVMADGTALHSVATGSGAGSATANINAVSELVTASIAGGSTTTYYTAFDSSKAGAVTTAAVDAAVAAVSPVLTTAGVSTSTLGNPTTATVDSSYTAALGTLNTALTNSGTSLSELSASVGGQSPNSAAPAVVSLPPELLTQPQASNCSALRSGTYRLISPRYSSLAAQIATLSVNASTLVVTNNTASTTDTWVPNGECRYIGSFGAANKSDIVVSQAGVIVMRTFNSADGVYRIAIAFPEQTHSVAELAGNWNTVATDRNTGTTALTAVYEMGLHTYTWTSGGSIANITSCHLVSGAVACAANTDDVISLSVNPSGGFDQPGHSASNPSDTWLDRTFAYKAGSGEIMTVSVGGDGAIALATKRAAFTPPTSGSVSDFWGVATLTPGATAGALTDGNFTNGATDSVASTYKRTSGIDGHEETLSYNGPLSGFFSRAAGSAATSTGGTVAISAFNGLQLRGMGLSVVWFVPTTGAAGLNVSVGKPSATSKALLPTYLLGNAHASTCRPLLSTTYRVIKPLFNSSSVYTMNLNAAALSYTTSLGGSGTLTPHASEPCRFTTDGGATDLMVSQAGVVVMRSVNSGGSTFGMTIAFPDQTVTLANLAHEWNMLGMAMNAGHTGYDGISATGTLSTAGTWSNVSWCQNPSTRSVATCAPISSPDSLTAAPGGGFTWAGGGSLYAYLARNGHMAVSIDPDGSFWIGTTKVTLTPTNESLYTNWAVSANTAMLAPANATTFGWTITAADTTAGSSTRISSVDGHSETLLYNNPRAGFTHRVSGTATTGSGGSVTFTEFTGLGHLRSRLGIAPTWLPDLGLTGALGNYQIAVQRP